MHCLGIFLFRGPSEEHRKAACAVHVLRMRRDASQPSMCTHLNTEAKFHTSCSVCRSEWRSRSFKKSASSLQIRGVGIFQFSRRAQWWRGKKAVHREVTVCRRYLTRVAYANGNTIWTHIRSATIQQYSGDRWFLMDVVLYVLYVGSWRMFTFKTASLYLHVLYKQWIHVIVSVNLKHWQYVNLKFALLNLKKFPPHFYPMQVIKTEEHACILFVLIYLFMHFILKYTIMSFNYLI